MKKYTFETRRLTAGITIYDEVGQVYATMDKKGFFKIKITAKHGSEEYGIKEIHKLFTHEVRFFRDDKQIAKFDGGDMLKHRGTLVLEESGEHYELTMDHLWKHKYRLTKGDDFCLRIEFVQEGLKNVGEIFFDKGEGAFFIIAIAHLTVWYSKTAE